MKSFILTKHYNMPMVAALMLTAWGLETLFSNHWASGALMMFIGLVAYFLFDRDPPVPIATPAPAIPTPAKPFDPVLLPIEWEAVFNEPVPVIPTKFYQSIANPGLRP